MFFSQRMHWFKLILVRLRSLTFPLLCSLPDHYRSCLVRAKRALASSVFPQLSLSMIEEDISSTLPSVHIFHPETGPLYQELKDMLCAWVVSRSDEGLGYASGAAKIAAMLLITMPVQQGFVVMRNLLERHCIRSFFGGEGTKDDVIYLFCVISFLAHIVCQVEAYYRWSLC
jgi:Rab-GTPase-TBC domain